MHFAARTIVPESVTDPLRYYGNNTCATRNLLAACQSAGVAHVVFSSTAAVYGTPKTVPVSEDADLHPESPYGTSKLMTELMLRDASAAHGFNYAVLRYFNVAGADPEIVLMATGNTPVMDLNIFQGMRTFAANIAVELPESEVDSTHYRVLFLTGVLLFSITFVVNLTADLVIRGIRKK